MLVQVPLIRSMGFGGVLIPVVSTLVVLTLLPALLSLVGPRTDWPRIRKESNASRAWSAWARGVVKYRWVAAGTALAALGLAVVPAFGVQVGQVASESLARNGSAYDGLLRTADGGIGNGVLTPMNLLVQSPAQAPALAAAAEAVDGIRMAVVAPPGKAGVTEIVVVPDRETVDSASTVIVGRVRDAVQDRPVTSGWPVRGCRWRTTSTPSTTSSRLCWG